MPLDNNATVSFCFTGLGLICINKNNGKLQVGLLDCPDHRHELVVDIQAISQTPEHELVSELVSHQLGFDRNLSIEVVNPAQPGITKYQNGNNQFNRRDNQTDPRDYRWIVDLEGPAFRNQPIAFPPLIKDPISIKPVITISDGILYTQQRTSSHFFALPTEEAANSQAFNQNSPGYLGPVAFKIGFDVVCEDKPESGILFKNDSDGGTLLELRKGPVGKKYMITVMNECDFQGDVSGASDFTLYYKAVSYPDQGVFDLKRVALADPAGGGNNPAVMTPEIVCEFGFLSQFAGFEL